MKRPRPFRIAKRIKDGGVLGVRNLGRYIHDPLTFLTRSHERGGDIAMLKMLGGTWVLLSHPEDLDRAFVKMHKHTKRDAYVVVLERGPNRIVTRMVGLDHHFPRPITAAGPTGELRDQGIGALDGAKIRKAEVGVGEEHRRQRNPRKVMAFGDHLGADQDLTGAACEPL